jgi:hypothetical protein
MAVVREIEVSGFGIASYSQQLAFLWALYLWVDDYLSLRLARFLWAAAFTFFTTFTLVDGLIMRMTSLTVHEILPMLLASQNVVEGLREIGLKPLRLLIIFAIVVAAAALGGIARLLMSELAKRLQRKRFSSRWCVALLLVLPLTFTLEQMRSRDSDDYLYREFHMPAYLQLYSTSSQSVVLPLQLPVSHGTRAQWLEHIPKAGNPRHVLYVLLESFRADVVVPAICPNIAALAAESHYFESGLAEATYTPLSWSVLLFDEAAHDNLFGRHPGRPEPLGAWLVAVMRKAGYHPHVYVSTNLTYAKTRERMLGDRSQPLDFFQAASDFGEDPVNKNANDRSVADHMVKFIERHTWNDDPQFMLLQLDSTHYTYPFPENEAVFKPYSENLVLPRPIETAEEARLLQSRYYNAAHYVDKQLGRVIAALKRAGIYDDMLIVLTADHGEGLSPGLQGHGLVGETTKRIPILFKAPELPPQRSSQPISQRDILPTLAELLKIELPAGSTRGRAVDRGAAPAVLTLAPSGRLGHLTTPGYTVELRLLFKPSTVTVTANATMRQSARSIRNQVPEQREWLPLLTRFLSGQDVSARASLEAAH